MRRFYNTRRRRLLHVISEEGPQTLDELAEATGTHPVRIYQDLLNMRHNGLVDWGGLEMAASLTPAACDILAATEAEAIGFQPWTVDRRISVLQMVARTPGKLTTRQVADELGTPLHVAAGDVHRLRDAGLLKGSREVWRYLWPTDEGYAFLERQQPQAAK